MRALQTWAVASLVALATSALLHNSAQAAQALLSAEVPAAKWKAVRLKNLPKDAAISIRVETSGPIDVIFVHRDELKRFPAAVNPEFQGSADRKLSFSVAVPKSGDYFVILDNRQHAQARQVRILIRAERGKKSEGAPPPVGDDGKKKKETEI